MDDLRESLDRFCAADVQNGEWLTWWTPAILELGVCDPECQQVAGAGVHQHWVGIPDSEEVRCVSLAAALCSVNHGTLAVEESCDPTGHRVCG